MKMEKLTLLQDDGRSTIQVQNERGDDFWILRTDKRAEALLNSNTEKPAARFDKVPGL